MENDGAIKWTTLEHNGVFFPPPYEPLPKHVRMKYAGMSGFYLVQHPSHAHPRLQASLSICHRSQKRSLGSMGP